MLAERRDERTVHRAVDGWYAGEVVGGDGADPGDVLLLRCRQSDAHARDAIAP